MPDVFDYESHHPKYDRTPDPEFISPSKLMQLLMERIEDFDNTEAQYDGTQNEIWTEQVEEFNYEYQTNYKAADAIRNYQNYRNNKNK